jgi:hypothetical protein
MSAIFDLTQLPGKIVNPRRYEISVRARLGLWEDYKDWTIDPQKHYDENILKNIGISTIVSLGHDNILTHQFENFGKIEKHHIFDDSDTGYCDLTIQVHNLEKLTVLDHTKTHMAGMIEIESLKLQGIEIKNILKNTLIGQDLTVRIPFYKPVYLWMINNWKSILPRELSNQLWNSEIGEYNGTNLLPKR